MFRNTLKLWLSGVALATFVLLFCLLAPAPALAHWSDLAVADVRVNERAAVVTITVPTGLVKQADDNHDGRLSAEEIERHADELGKQMTGAIQLTSHGEPGLVVVRPSKAAPAGSDLAGADGSHSTLELTYSWPHPVTGVTIQYGLFIPGVATARCLATINMGDLVDNVVFTPASPSFSIGEGNGGGVWRQAASFVGLGIEHILTGYDHCLFLISLLMLGGGLRYVLKVVTAFTLAHSITLSLAVLQIVSLPPRLTESAIALTIVYVAAENFWRKSLDGRWIVTFLFGLIHGFGFASALAETGLPKENLAVSLASFNIGVEIGQLLVVTLAFGLLGLVRSRSWEPRFRQVVSAGVIGMALFWFVQRAFFTA
jgi:hypothetical protein